jgi:hypothetical protein
MGAFHLKFEDDGPELVLPNILHNEWTEKWLRLVFGIPPAVGSVPTLGFVMGLSGVFLGYPDDKPNQHGGVPLSDEDIIWDDLLIDALNPHGGFHNDQRDLLGLYEQPITFTVSQRSGAIFIETDWYRFPSAIYPALQWTPTPDAFYDALGEPTKPPWRRYTGGYARQWEEGHRYPWLIPTKHREELRDTSGTPNIYTDPIADNMNLGASFPIGAVFIRTPSDSGDELLLTARTKRGVVIRPGGGVSVMWKGCISPDQGEAFL